MGSRAQLSAKGKMRTSSASPIVGRFPRRSERSWLAQLVALWFCVIGAPADGESSAAPTKWRGLDAVRLTDGRSEAVIVPALGGRLVHYGLIGGLNWMWCGEPGAETRTPALFWGGDKTYIGPHTMWPFTLPRTWPPPPPDSLPHQTPPPPAGVLFSSISEGWPEYGPGVRRDYVFTENGDLVITHSIDRRAQSRMLGAVWVITQIIPADRIFVPLNPKSPYKDNLFWFGWSAPREKVGATFLSSSLLQIEPVTGTMFKLGANPIKPALAAVKDGWAFVQRADPQEGQYPEGADGAGMSVEVYHHDLPGAGEYTELEMLSPLRRLDAGATLTTRWSIHEVPKNDLRASIESLLGI